MDPISLTKKFPEPAMTWDSSAAEGEISCVIEASENQYLIKMETKAHRLRDLELEFTNEELTVSGRIELDSGQVSSPFERRFTLLGVYEGQAIEAFYRGTTLHIVVPRSRTAPTALHLAEGPSVYYRPALGSHREFLTDL